ncbi:Zeatin O-xylosyltransferase [Bienertia sinuspersici]
MESQNFNLKKLLPEEVAVVMVPLPLQGHLNQLLHFAHLIPSYGLPVHYIGSAIHNRQAKLRLHGWNSQSSAKIHFHDLPLPSYIYPLPNPDNSVHFPAQLQPVFNASVHLRQPVFQLVQQLSTKFRRVVVIHDCLMNSVVQDVKDMPNAETYIFMTTSAFTTFSYIWEGVEPKPFPLDDSDALNLIPTNDGCYTPEVLEFGNNQKKLMGFESGWLYNTSKVIDGKYIQLLEKLSANDKIKHYAVGPLNPVETKNTSEGHRHKCLEWLDKQEKGSVIFVSFGSTTSMKDEQITELAMGLERSAQKFIWVVRRADIGDVFTGSSEVKTPELPEGFEERVKNRGMVVREWAPQLEILQHSSVGGFMSHCGWNSCIESISMGVVIAAWPMHSEQPRNAVMITDELRIGILLRDWVHRDEVVSSGTIENVVTRLMASDEGEGIRKRAAEVGDAVRASVAKGGVSRLEMNSFISHITR